MIEDRRERVALAALVPEWDRLLERAPRAGIFQTPEWLLPWWAIFGAPSDSLRVLLLREAGGLRALLPLYEDGVGALRFLGAGLTDLHELVAEPAYEAAAAAAFLRDLGEGGQTCVLEQLPEDSPLARDPRAVRQEVRPVLALPPTVEAFRAGLPRSLRSAADGRQERRLAAEHGPTEVVRVHARRPEVAQLWLEVLFDLHGARWKAAGRRGVLEDHRVREFHRAVVRGTHRRSRLRLWGLTVDGHPAAVLYGFRHRETVSSYLGGIEPSLSAHGPGTILLAAAIEDSIAEGARAFDFLRGGERSRYRWGAVDRVQVKRVLQPRSLESRERLVS